MISSTPNLLEFNPHDVPFQFKVIRDIRRNFDYSLGTHELLLSGSVGSAKSILMAHIICTHCILYPGANFGVGRRALPKLKATLLKKIREHLYNTGIKYTYNKSSGDIDLSNGSKITAFSWADGNFDKFGSFELSGMAFEELVENKDDNAYQMALTRVGRLPHVKENIVVSATNPKGPSHWAYKRFIGEPTSSRHTYYSLTEQNKFLPKSYIEGLRANLDPKLARRLLYGEWVEIDSERIYHAYQKERNFIDCDYVVNPNYPVRLSYDFNIAAGKPLSVIFFQFIDERFHFFDEIIIEGQRTQDSLEEAESRGLLDYKTQYIIHGDATGKHADTRSKRSDYDIIDKFLANHKQSNGEHIRYELQVPKSNPPIRTRHNTVNAWCHNDLGQVRVYVHRKCKKLDEGMRLTALKDKAQYIEDDSKDYQHCTTALGYAICTVVKTQDLKKQGTVQL